MEIRFDAERADRAVDFFEQLLVHTKGIYARRPFILGSFQREEIIRPLFGTVTLDPELDDWVRLFNVAWLEMGRKNGKSEVMAGIALLMTGGDDEEGAEVYGVAKDKDQAILVFAVAKRMLELSGLGGLPRSGLPFTIYETAKRIVYSKTGSFYSVIAADALGNLGQDPHAILFDEIIAQPNGELWDALKTGMGSRRQPLLVAATTAGDDPTSFAQTEHDFCARILEDPSIAPRRFVFMRNVPKDVDPGDESQWPLGNPALKTPDNPEGFLRLQVLRDEYHEAFGPDGNVRARKAFRQFRLNQWQEESIDSPIPIEDWNASVGLVDETKLKGRRAFGGVVTNTIDDLTAINWVFPPVRGETAWQSLWRFFIPADALSSLDRRTEGQASLWAKTPELEVTEGAGIDVARHTAVLRADIRTFDVAELAWLQNGAIGVVQPLMEDDVCPLVKMTPTTGGSMLLDWARLVHERAYFHGSNPVMRWQMACLKARVDVHQVTRIDSKASRDRVPGPIAAELALRRALIAVPPKSKAVGGIDF